MPFAAAFSTSADASRALEEVCSQAGGQLGGRPNLALLFFSPHHADAAAFLAKGIQDRLKPTSVLGCPGEAVVGKDQEMERRPALSLWLAQWRDGVQQYPFHLQLEETAEGPSLLGWPDPIEEVPADRAAILLLGDPFSFPVDAFLNEVNQRSAPIPVMGGMASGIGGSGQACLLLDGQVIDRGAVGVLITGAIKVRPIVSQGCRPVGRHMVITKAQDNIILELSGKPPLAQLQQIWEGLGPQDRELFQRGLHIGRVINEYQGEFHRGDFLVRNVLGIDRESGALAVTDRVRVGQTVQFHVRDAASADEDLRALLQMDVSSHERRPAGALLFTCNGRGTRLFPEPHHDARTIRSEVGSIPLAGFFAQGEIGPIRGQNCIHGFTASVCLFED
jgi:small ligand-binding sensory domain FIST